LNSGGKGTQPVTIREARADDAETVAALCAQLGYPSSPEQVGIRLDEILADAEHIVLVAERSDEEVIGWVQVHIRKLLVADRHAEMVGLVVDQGHRGQKVGLRLMEAAEGWARSQACVAVRLRTNVVRTEAHQFYETLGYKLLKTQRAYHKAL
jgi:GNAT superfamily N-acetyltransferase